MKKIIINPSLKLIQTILFFLIAGFFIQSNVFAKGIGKLDDWRFISAEQSVREGNYQEAINLLNQSLEDLDNSQIYKKNAYYMLAEIYRDLGDLKQELKYRQLSYENQIDDNERLDELWRVKQIKNQLEHPQTKIDFGERYPLIPGINRKFNSFREVKVAAGNSHTHYLKAEEFFKSKQYEKAIEEYELGYFPTPSEMPDLVVQWQLVQCYAQLKRCDEALALLEHILSIDDHSLSFKLGESYTLTSR